MLAASAIRCDSFIDSGSYVYKNRFYRHMLEHVSGVFGSK